MFENSEKLPELTENELQENDVNLKDTIKNELTSSSDAYKNVREKASDAIIVLGAKKASQDDSFIDVVSQNFQQGVLTLQEAENMQKDRLKAQEYFIKWEAVLNLVKLEKAQGLGLMRIIVVLMIVPYIIWNIVRFIFYLFDETFRHLNDLCNAVFGSVKKIQTDKDGKPIVDGDGKSIKSYGFNLATKILLGIIIAAVILGVIILIVRVFTGINIIKILVQLKESAK